MTMQEGVTYMKLYMKQKVFSLKDRFYIKDEQGNDRYYVEGEFFSIGRKLHLYDMNGNELAFIQQKVLTFLPRFFVYMNGKNVAEIVKEFTFLRPKYSINGLGWNVDGDIWSHDYSVLDNGRNVASVHKAWFSWGDSYEIDISNREEEVLTLAVVLAIDAVLYNETVAASSAASS